MQTCKFTNTEKNRSNRYSNCIEHDPKNLQFSFQKHKSNIDLKWQMAQFTRYEKTSPMGAKLMNELKKKGDKTNQYENPETADMRELHN